MTQRRPTSAVRLLLSRALLVIAVLTGLGAMHVVASPAAAHAAMPMAGTAATSSAHAGDLASASADDSGTGGHGTGGHGTGGHGLMADCLPFAATGATLLAALLAALLTAAAVRRWLVPRGTPGTSSSASRWTPVHRRPPPAARPLIALCVIRT